MHYKVYLRDKNTSALSLLPSKAKFGDTADVYMLSNATQRLIHEYIFTTSGWQFSGYRIEDISSNN